jgi:hypothetical protein
VKTGHQVVILYSINLGGGITGVVHGSIPGLDKNEQKDVYKDELFQGGVAGILIIRLLQRIISGRGG